jgi:hypothetical protein
MGSCNPLTALGQAKCPKVLPSGKLPRLRRSDCYRGNRRPDADRPIPSHALSEAERARVIGRAVLFTGGELNPPRATRSDVVPASDARGRRLSRGCPSRLARNDDGGSATDTADGCRSRRAGAGPSGPGCSQHLYASAIAHRAGESFGAHIAGWSVSRLHRLLDLGRA